MLQLGCREPTQAKASFTTGSRLCLKEKGGAEGGSGVRDGSAQAALRPRVRAREPKSSNKQPRFHGAGQRGLLTPSAAPAKKEEAKKADAKSAPAGDKKAEAAKK